MYCSLRHEVWFPFGTGKNPLCGINDTCIQCKRIYWTCLQGKNYITQPNHSVFDPIRLSVKQSPSSGGTIHTGSTGKFFSSEVMAHNHTHWQKCVVHSFMIGFFMWGLPKVYGKLCKYKLGQGSTQCLTGLRRLSFPFSLSVYFLFIFHNMKWIQTNFCL